MSRRCWDGQDKDFKASKARQGAPGRGTAWFCQERQDNARQDRDQQVSRARHGLATPGMERQCTARRGEEPHASEAWHGPQGWSARRPARLRWEPLGKTWTTDFRGLVPPCMASPRMAGIGKELSLLGEVWQCGAWRDDAWLGKDKTSFHGTVRPGRAMHGLVRSGRARFGKEQNRNRLPWRSKTGCG